VFTAIEMSGIYQDSRLESNMADDAASEGDEVASLLAVEADSNSAGNSDGDIGQKVMNYVLNRTKALQKKFKRNGEEGIEIVLKDSSKCGVITYSDTVDFEQTRENIALRYWQGVPLRKSKTQSSAEWFEHSDNSELVVQDSITLFDQSVKLAKVTIYRTCNKIMVQGVHTVQWLCYEFPLILEGINNKKVVFDFHRRPVPECYQDGPIVAECNNQEGEIAAGGDYQVTRLSSQTTTKTSRQ
jgi:hypothetical protein